MLPHQQRVLTKRNDLQTKVVDLIFFMHEDVYAGLPAVEQGLLMVQLVAMQNYESALNRRIELF